MVRVARSAAPASHGDSADAEKLARADLNDLAALQVEAIKTRSTIRGIAPAAFRLFT